VSGDRIFSFHSLQQVPATPTPTTHLRVRNDVRRRTQEANLLTVLFDITVSCDDCGSTSELFGAAVIGKQGFTKLYSRDVQGLSSNITVDTVKEIEEMSCGLPSVGFSKIVAIELVQ
jgi:hypothetical protein